MKVFLCFSLAVLLFVFGDWFLGRLVILDGQLFHRDDTVLVLEKGLPEQVERLGEFTNLYWLDLQSTGITPEEYEAVRQAAGKARILWALSFQGKPVDARTPTLEIRQLTDADAALLEHLPRLNTILAEDCRDYPQLLLLKRRHPDWDIRCRVKLGEGFIGPRETYAAPEGCTEEELRLALSLLPRLKRVDLRGTGLSAMQARSLSQDHPWVRFLWNEQLGDIIFPTNAREIDLSGVLLEGTEELEALLPYLPETEKIILCDCGLSSEVLAELGQRHPEIRFVWRVKLGPLSARTDDTWFAPITKRQLIGGTDADELKYCVDMECIDLGHCWIRDCEWARFMPKLRYLVLADTYVRDLSPLSGLKELAYLELFVTPVKDYSPLLGCTGLEDLNLGYTYGDPTPISRMTWLKNLWWGGIHYVPQVGNETPAAMLQHGLPETKIMLYAGSSTGMGWRNLPHYYEMRDIIGMYYMTG